MKLIVGLGNPGKEYKNTRHNIGFMVLDELLGKVKYKTKLESDIYITDDFGEEVIFMKPLTYMNLSGMALRKIVNYYKIDINDVLIIQDDLDLEVGTYKIKKNSSSGGHNGLKSIIMELGTTDIARLKIGIGKNKQIPTDKYVLSKFTINEMNILNENMEKYKEIVKSFIINDIEKVMREFN